MAFAGLLSQVDKAILESPLANTITYVSGTGVAVVVNGIFDEAYELVSAGESGVSSAGPAVFVRLEGLPSNPETDLGARLTARGRDYEVREVRPDGQGGVVLLLHEAGP